MSLTQKQLMNLQKVGRISKLLDKKKELDLLNEKFYAPEYQVIKAGRASAEDKPLKNQISNLAELAQVIKQSREKQFELSQAKILSELKQSEFFEKQAKPVVKAVEENAPDDNTEEIKELKNRLLKIGMPLVNILSIEENLKSVVSSVSKSDSENDRYEMVSQYNALFRTHPSVSGFEDQFENILNDYYGLTSRVKYEKVKSEVEAGIPTLTVRLNEDDTRQLLNDSETGLSPEQIQQLIGYLLSKGIIDESKPVVVPPPPPPSPPVAPPPPPVAPPPVIPDDGERKAEPPAPVEPPRFSDYENEVIRDGVNGWMGIVFTSRRGKQVETKTGAEDKIENWLKTKRVEPVRRDDLLYEIVNQIQEEPAYKKLRNPREGKGMKKSILTRIRGLGLTMEDLRAKTSSGIRKKLGLIPPSEPSGVILGKGLNISDMTPAQLMNNLALNIASQKAGNSGVGDIINSIIDEMNRKNIISKAEHKKLWYAYCD